MPLSHLYAGSDKERASVGLPGHCDRCATYGHVVAHPDLGCADVGCEGAYPPDDDVTRDLNKAVALCRSALRRLLEVNRERERLRIDLAEVTDEARRLTNTQDQLRADLREATMKLSEYIGQADDLRAELATARRNAAADALEEGAQIVRRVFMDSVSTGVALWLDAVAADIRKGRRPVPGSPQPGNEESA